MATTSQNRAGWLRRRARNLERAMQMPRVLCECGCETPILALKPDGTRRRFASGHGRSVVRTGLQLPEFSQPGACSQPWVDPEWFWTESDLFMQQDAKRVCAGCPIRLECLQWAMDRKEPGLWGGLTERERAQARRRSAA